MMKLLLVLALGLVLGYAYGFKDAKTHQRNIASRMIDRAGGSNRDNFNNDIDRRTRDAQP